MYGEFEQTPLKTGQVRVGLAHDGFRIAIIKFDQKSRKKTRLGVN